MSNADLIERLRDYSRADTDVMLDEAADALELADKRISELEIIVSGQQMLGYLPKGVVTGSVCGLSADELIERLRFADEAERKLAVAREALELNISDPLTKTAMDAAREALAQIGGE